jgi:hypothetical protein
MNEYTSVQQGHLISPDDAAQVILAAFANPAAVPLACINVLTYSYGVLSETIMRSSAPNNSRMFIRRYKDVLSRTMKFLCSFRSAEQFRALEQTLERGPCRCAQGPEALRNPIAPVHHHVLLKAGTGRVLGLIDVIDELLSQSMERRGQGLKKLYKTTRGTLWPTSINDLVPDGSASLHGIVRWLPQMDADTVAQAEHVILIGSVLRTMPSYLRGGIMKGPILVDWLHRTLSTWTMQPINIHAGGMSPEIEATGALLEPACYLSKDEILLWLSSSPRHSIQEMFSLIDRAFTRVVNYPSHAVAYKQIQLLRWPYKRILEYFILSNDFSMPIVPALYTSASDDEELRRVATDPVVRLCRVAYEHSWSQRCYGPGCIATYADRSKRFKRCGGCRTAEYCSPKCQRVAWRHPEAPHRELCGLFRMCEDRGWPHGVYSDATAVPAWGALPREQLDAAFANIENLRATQLPRTSACSLMFDLERRDLIVLAGEEIESIFTDQL